MAAAGAVVGSPLSIFAANAAHFISANIERELFEQAPSVPSTRRRPAVRFQGKSPLTSFMLLCWFSTMTAPVSRMTAMSSSVRWTQCAITVFGPSRPQSRR